jgi:hypothetical protein
MTPETLGGNARNFSQGCGKAQGCTVSIARDLERRWRTLCNDFDP